MKTAAHLQLNELQNPSAIYRSAPFWSWNGEMEEERVAKQLSAFYEVGMGGGFIHSRSGLKTPYMEDQWFACVQAAIDTAVREGGKVYLYDEDRYSSGFAGGDVCRQNPDFRQRHLTVATAPVPDSDTIATFAVRIPVTLVMSRLPDASLLHMGLAAIGIKPVLHVNNDGKLISRFNVRGRKKAIKALCDKMGEIAENINEGPVYICHGDCIDDANLLASMIKEAYGLEVEIIAFTGPVIGSHSGPGTLALFFLGKER